MSQFSIELVGHSDLVDLLPLMRLYCEFYKVHPSDEALAALSGHLIESPDSNGRQLIARDPENRAVGFATLFWTWQTLNAARAAVMNDLYIDPSTRGTGLADELIERCASLAKVHGAPELVWQTALDNFRAQSVYDRVGAERSQWIDYTLPLA